MRALLLLAALASPALAQSGGDRAREAAEAFSLDLPPAEDAAPDDGAAGAVPDAGEPQPNTAAPETAFSLDTPIEALVASRRARRVLDKEMPGLSSDKNLPKFSKLSLRQLAPLSGGRVTPELLEKVRVGLAGLD